MLDSEWPARKAAFERWLAPENFDADGKQKASLGEIEQIGVSARPLPAQRRVAERVDGQNEEEPRRPCTSSSPARPA